MIAQVRYPTMRELAKHVNNIKIVNAASTDGCVMSSINRNRSLRNKTRQNANWTGEAGVESKLTKETNRSSGSGAILFMNNQNAKRAYRGDTPGGAAKSHLTSFAAPSSMQAI